MVNGSTPKTLGILTARLHVVGVARLMSTCGMFGQQISVTMRFSRGNLMDLKRRLGPVVGATILAGNGSHVLGKILKRWIFLLIN